MRTLIIRIVPLAAVLAAAVAAAPARAALSTYAGRDAGAGPGDARPNSDAAAAAFDAAAGALGGINLVTFESLATGIYPNLSLPGVDVTFTNQTTGFNTISLDFDAANGYNTTVGGSKFLLLFRENSSQANSVTFTFATPVQAFGAYFTGIGTAAGSFSAQFDDGSAQVLPITGGTDGGVQFFGFTDAGKSIVSVTLQNDTVGGDNGDAIGVDDVRFVSATVVPEPSTLVAGGLGVLFLAGWAYGCRKRSGGRGKAECVPQSSGQGDRA